MKGPSLVFWCIDYCFRLFAHSHYCFLLHAFCFLLFTSCLLILAHCFLSVCSCLLLLAFFVPIAYSISSAFAESCLCKMFSITAHVFTVGTFHVCPGYTPHVTPHGL